MSNLVYIGSVGWASSASAIHVQNRARLMNNIGFTCYAISDYPNDNNLIDDMMELQYCYMSPYKGERKIRGLKWNIDQFVCIFSYPQIITYLNGIKPEYIILYEINSIILQLALLRYCKKNGIKCIIETSEWMGSEKYENLQTYLITKQKDIQRKYIDKRFKNIIAISAYLEKHYKEQKCHVIKVPPLFGNLEDNLPITRHEDMRCDAQVKLVFAGTLSKKDYIESILKALIKVNEQNIRIAFDVIGPNAIDIQELLAIDNLESIGVFCHGFLPHNEVLYYVQRADFSVLLRENMIYAKAGVSTKFVEAMCLGVPSICTKVGGTDIFVKNGENGFLIDSNSENEIKNILEYILQMSEDEILAMKKSAYEFAMKTFSMDMYGKAMKDFLEKCK